MNANTQTEPAPSAAEYAQRILDERVRLNAEQRLQIELTEQRKIPLEAGDDKVLDSIDSKIGKCVDRQARIEERITILQQRQAEAVIAEQELADLALAEQAEALRQQGVKLIERDYPRIARVLVKLFEKMNAIDAQIYELNSQIKDPQKFVASPNDIRTIPGFTKEEQVYAGSVGLESPKHPRHGTPTYFDAVKRCVCYADTKERVDRHPLMITRTYEVAAIRQAAITQATALPGFWNEKGTP